MNTYSLNGTLLSAADARISCDERGFRFGDGVFETIPVHHGVTYLGDAHLQRLAQGLKILNINYDPDQLPALIAKVIEANTIEEGVIRVYISRGTGSRGYLPAAQTAQPTCLIQPLPLPEPAPRPATLWLSRWRKPAPEMLPNQFKLAQGVGPMLARMEAESKQCYEALQLSADGMIGEASSANVFWIASDTLHTPPLTTGALAGVTRRRLRENPFAPVRETTCTPKDLAKAEAVFLTNATQGIVPIGKLLPLGLTWNTHPMIETLKDWRAKDIITQCTRR